MIIETKHESIPTLSLIASLAILLAVLAPLLGAATIVAGVMFPFLVGMTGFVWYIDLYIPSSEIIQLYMTYTVDLSLVMRRLFWEMRRFGGVQSLPEEVFQSVHEGFENTIKSEVHEDIWSFVTENRFKRFNQENVLEKIAELIDKYHADPEVKASDSSSVASLDTQSESIFSPVDLSKWWNKLSQPPLATGGNSDVYKTSLIPGPHYPTEQLIAVKVLRPVRIPDEKLTPEILKKRLLREAQIWIQLNHKNIIPLLGFCFQDNIPCLVSPWFENGDALNYISKHPEADRSRLVAESIEGVVYLHTRSPPVVHGDLKASNILIDNDGRARITDFGTSRILQEERTGFTTSSEIHGTHRWMAPELLLYEDAPPSTKTDIYSLTLLF
ncbi:hypothetical protein FRC03_001400 [Tulasnella sp. 419]|nr:hypothetical protein FRC03_001400 [Tulasnella sp. 419]